MRRDRSPESQGGAPDSAAQVRAEAPLWNSLQKTFEEATAGINAEADAAVAAEVARIPSRECGEGRREGR